jgi:hypothetical protein
MRRAASHMRNGIGKCERWHRLCEIDLGIPMGAMACRGYIQNWLAGATIPERSAQRIFAAADKILRAGIERQSQGGAE